MAAAYDIGLDDVLGVARDACAAADCNAELVRGLLPGTCDGVAISPRKQSQHNSSFMPGVKYSRGGRIIMQTLESEKVQNKDIIVWGLTNSGAILLTRGDFATSSDFKIDCSGIRRRAFLHFIFQVANNSI